MRRSLAAALVALRCLAPSCSWRGSLRVRATDRDRPARRRHRPALARATDAPRRCGATARPRRAGARPATAPRPPTRRPPWRCATCSSPCPGSTRRRRVGRAGAPGPADRRQPRPSTTTATRCPPSGTARGGSASTGSTRTKDAPPQPALGVPHACRVMKNVWAEEVGRLGYRRPRHGRPPRRQRKFDVYLKDVGVGGLLRLLRPRAPQARAPLGRLGLLRARRRLRPQPVRRAGPHQSLRVTAAHEFFHAIQFGYDYAEDGWLMEATATWVEERVADDVNDNRQYLAYGQVAPAAAAPRPLPARPASATTATGRSSSTSPSGTASASCAGSGSNADGNAAQLLHAGGQA